MADRFIDIRVNDQPMRVALANFTSRIEKRSLLKIAGNYMRGSIEKTFREQGSPSGSWAPLAASTIKRDKTAGPGRKILIKTGQLKNSITYALVGSDRLLIGSNLKQAAIQQLGGEAGRRPPFKKTGGRRPMIPARPYIVFRPEDPANMAKAMQIFVDSQAAAAGLKP
jgi:phage virion morphogenesis protein